MNHPYRDPEILFPRATKAEIDFWERSFFLAWSDRSVDLASAVQRANDALDARRKVFPPLAPSRKGEATYMHHAVRLGVIK